MTGNATADGGTGSWDGATVNWTGDAGATNQAWVAGSSAIFGGTAGTVSVVGTQVTDYITVETDGYLLTGGALSFNATGASGVTVETGTTTIASDITSTNGFDKDGAGTLVLSGSNSLSGTLSVSQGNLVATNPNALSGITYMIIRDSGALTPVSINLGGADVTVSGFILQGNGATGMSNGTVTFSSLGEFGNATIDTILAGTGGVFARRWSGYHRRSRVETKMHCVKLLGQRLMARDFDRQVAELQVRIAVLNGYTALGIPVTEAVG